MITFPNAKINLGLNIVNKRPDGYHNLETIFYPIPLEDVLEIEVSEDLEQDFKLHISGTQVDGDAESNLVVKAYRLLKDKYEIPPIHIYLHKVIPSGAGLGGGSADAAFMLKLINETFELDIPTQKLEEYAATLGADCAFFIKNQPTFAQGIGNVFTPLSLSLQGYILYLIKPPVFISTAMAFSNIKPQEPEESLLSIIKGPIEEWKNKMVNDFEASLFPQLPELAQLKQSLYDAGAIYAAMSGSGSSIYGLFKDSCPLQADPEKGKYLITL